jgi:L-alanine-DL-glutamate epimerase-like enolase superfamily enzyme
MTTIDEVRVHRRSMPLVRPFVTAVRTAYALDAVIVELRDADGRSGWGEAAVSWRVTGESPESVTAAVLGPIREALVGLPVADLAAVSAAICGAVAQNPSARAAVEDAAYDLAARLAGEPLWRHLGGERRVVTTDMTLSALAPGAGLDDLVAAAVEHVAAGFTTLKVKAGGGGDDRHALPAVRAAVGPDVTLRVDANQGWTPRQAVETITAWEDAGVGLELVEQPVFRDDLAGLAYVARSVATPVMADESVWTRRQLDELLAHGARTLVNIKLAKTGGLREALALAERAAEHGLRAIVGCMSESDVAITAAGALASVLDTRGWSLGGAHDLDAGRWIAAGPALGGVRYDGESIDLGEGIGTGISGLASPAGRRRGRVR